MCGELFLLQFENWVADGERCKRRTPLDGAKQQRTHDGASYISNLTHLMEGTVRDMRLSFRDRRHLSKNFQLTKTRPSEHSTIINPVPAPCSSRPAQLASLESTSSTADWRVSHELGRIAMALTLG